MATGEDELAKQQVQEAIWAWAGRFVVIAAVFIIGLASGFWLWGYGPQGAGHLRQLTVQQQAKFDELDKKRVDLDGRLTVADTRLSQCLGDLQRARAAAAPPAAN